MEKIATPILASMTFVLTMASSLAMASTQEIQTLAPGFYESGSLTSIAISPDAQLPSTYSDFVEMVRDAFGPDSVTDGPEKYGTRADEICDNDPESRACYHAQSIQRIDEIPHAYRKATPRHPEMSYRKYDLNKEVLDYSPQYPVTKQVYISQQDAILFSTDARTQTKLMNEMRAKLKTSKSPLAVVYQYGNAQRIPGYSRSYIPESQVRIIDADCNYVGTPTEYLKRATCK